MSQQPSPVTLMRGFLERSEYRAAMAAYQQSAIEGYNGLRLLSEWAHPMTGGGGPDAAIAKLEATLDLDSNAAEAHAAKVLMSVSFGRVEEALELFERAGRFIHEDAILQVEWGTPLDEQEMHEASPRGSSNVR